MKQGIAQSIRDQRRDRILETAREVFFEHGFATSTMSMIAERLGGSKATLYAYFKNKEDLFSAIITEQCSVIQNALIMDDGGADVRTTLTKLGIELMTAIVSDQAVRTMQLVIEEGPRNPELARRFDEAGPQEGAARLAAYMARAHERGTIHVPDPLQAAHVLSGLLKGEMHLRRMLGIEPEPSAERIAKEVDIAVNVFLAAYGPR